MKNTIEKALQKKREQENTQVENTPQNEVVGQEIQQPAAKPNLMSSNVEATEKEKFELNLLLLEERGYISLTGSS